MISYYDYFVIASYFVFVLGIGLIFRRLSKDTSDYFRCGGAMPWWITGTSAWIAGFTVWTFTGAAGKVYDSGTLVMWVYTCGAVALILTYFYTANRFRRMRVVTWMEGVGLRYGTGTELFYTWVKVPLLLFLGGVGLNAVGVFMSSVFHVRMEPVLIVLGTVVTIVSFAGGAWAVLASDFVQMFLVVTITLAVAWLTLRQPQIGGISGLVHKIPSYQFHWTQLRRLPIVVLWIAVMMWFKFSDQNNMENATMYLMAKSDRDARKMVLIPLIGCLLGPLIWFIPSMAATITHPHLQAEYPNLPHPQEAAYVAVCLDLMPRGMLGLLLCAMLGATLTSMDAALNKGVGVFVRSFYLPALRPNATERHLLVVSKMGTLLFGAIIIGASLLVNRYRSMELFDLSNQLAALLIMPLALPLIFGLYFKRTPPWSAWTTALIGFTTAAYIEFCVSPQKFAHLLGWSSLSSGEATDLTLVMTNFGMLVVGTAWYFATALFYRRTSPQYQANVERFFAFLRTPIDARREGIVDRDQIIYRLIGGLCLVYGSFVLLLLLIPNPLSGRLSILFVGATITLAGAVLYRRALVLAASRAMDVGDSPAVADANPLAAGHIIQ